jgi:hypothetical protein
LDSTFQVPINELIPSSKAEFVEKLNKNVATINPARIVGIISALFLFLIGSMPWLGCSGVAGGLLLCVFLNRRFKEAHTQAVNYSLDSDASSRFSAVCSALDTLGTCSSIWVVNTQTATSDTKRNAGANTLVTRKSVSTGKIPKKGFVTDLDIRSINANGVIFHFLPDQVLVFSQGRYGAIEYGDLHVGVSPTNYIESEYVPRDSIQVSTTWRYVNKSGGPDRRFNNNRQFPVLRYGEATIRNSSNFRVVLQTSSYDKAVSFARQLSASGADQSAPPPADRPSANGNHTMNDSLSQSYALLGLTRPTTLELAAAAHRHQAMLYHPDKYEHLAPEMKQLAAVKMQEINAAYSRVRMDIQQ